MNSGELECLLPSALGVMHINDKQWGDMTHALDY
jgi:hypothetical protein